MRFLRPAVGFAISALAVYLLIRGIHWNAVVDGLQAANHALIIAALPLLLLLFAARAFRWHLFFEPADDVRVWSAFKAINVGYLAGNILPLQMGELARVYALGEETRVPKFRVLSTVAVERVLDLLLLLVAAAVLGPIIGLPAPAAIALIAVVSIVVTAALFVSLAVVDRPRVERWSAPIVRLLPDRFEHRLFRIRDSLLDGVAVLKSWRRLLAITLWTAGTWILSAVIIYVLLQAMHVDVPPSAAPFLLITTTLAFLIPSSPGAVGVYDAVTVTVLVTVFDVNRELATSYALVAHALYLVPPTIMGAIFVWTMNLRLPALRNAGHGQGATPEPLRPTTAPGPGIGPL